MSCGKITYKTKALARSSKRNHRKKHRYVRFYKCPDCDLWHLTSSHTRLDAQIRYIERGAEFAEAIQSKKAEFIERLSNKKTVWEIALDEKRFIVTYNKRTKTCVINHYLGKGEAT